MAYLEGVDRNQTTYLVTSLDDFIGNDNPIRVIDAFINSLNLKKLGFVIYDSNKQGQCPYDRKVLLKLHVYGYMNGIRSSRKLERETGRNIEIMWLINSLKPDHGTIAAFIKDNKKAFRNVLKEFTLLLKGWGLIDGKLIAIDGTKLKAQNSKHNYITESVLQKKIEYVEEKIEEYLKQIESNDAEENLNNAISNKNVVDLQSKIESYKQMKEAYEQQKKEMKDQKVRQICKTDSDARGMKNNGKFEVFYNVQTSVDSKNKLIIDCDVVNDVNDLNQLSNMTLRAKSLLRKRKLKVLADTGYYNAEEIKKCLDKKAILYIKKAKSNNTTGQNKYRKDNFKYEENTDTYICPEGKDLAFSEYSSKNGIRYKRYKCKSCKECSKKSLCTTAKKGRNIQRWEFEELLDQVAEITHRNNNIYKKRQCIVEHPFGTVKRTLGYTYFLRKGLESVNAEAASIFVAYNLKRIINILTVPILIEKFSQLSIR
jgi:transposase/archaellum component FlaF (FlaF/FlaG flagellin family)